MREDSRPLPVPASRLARGLRSGSLAARLAAGMLPGAARALRQGRRPDPRDLLITPGNMRRLSDELARMRGAAMKLGQLLSMESEDLVPPELTAILARLRNGAHHMPPRQLKQVLQAQYGADALSRFRRFDVRPLAAASIGQVHRAVTQDGRELALKIQYPGIRTAIDADIANLGVLMRHSGLLPRGLDPAPLLEEARRQLHEEADYRREATELTRFAALVGDDPQLALPRPHEDLSTGDILAMDFMPGQPLDSVITADQAVRDRVATTLCRLFLHEMFDWGHVQTDAHFANYLYQPESGRIVLLDYGAAREVSAARQTDLRALLRALVADDPDAILTALTTLGFLHPDTPAPQRQTVLAMARHVTGVLHAEEKDFGDTATLDAMRRLGERLGMEQGYAVLPPADILFLQRKLAGLVLLATRLRARVPAAALVAEWA